MKKIVFSLFCICGLNATTKDISLEEQILDYHIKNIEKINQEIEESFNDDVFINFDRIEQAHKQVLEQFDDFAIKQLEKSKNNDKNEFYLSNQNAEKIYKINDIISSVRQYFQTKNNKATKQTIFKTINNTTNQELKLDDMIKNRQQLQDFLSQTNDLSGIILDNFYLDSYGFVFCSDDLLKTQQISYDEIKPYLKEEIIKLIWD